MGTSSGIFKSIRVIASLNDGTMVGNAIQECRGHFGIAKYLHPLTKVKVGGKDQRGFFI